MKTKTNAELEADFIDWPVHMARAVAVAQNVMTATPNPRVGCVIKCSGGEYIEGWHKAHGQAHAEAMALAEADRAGLDVTGAAVFVSLEPCAHQGRTGPCARALVEAGVETVAIAVLDPNPKVAGQGVAILEAAGISVVHMIDFEAPAREMNLGFLKRFESGMPFVRLKLAMSLDGRTAMASGESKWITGADARREVQRMRASVSAIVTGVGSVLEDDPAMNVRADEMRLSSTEAEFNQLGLAKQPIRALVDSHLRTPPSAKIFGPGQVIVYTLAADEQTQRFEQSLSGAADVEVVACEASEFAGSKRVNLQSVLESLAQKACNEVLVEAGATLGGAFIEAGLVDELVVFIAPKLLGADAKPLLALQGLVKLAAAPSFQIHEMTQVGQDIKITLRPLHS